MLSLKLASVSGRTVLQAIELVGLAASFFYQGCKKYLINSSWVKGDGNQEETISKERVVCYQDLL